MRRGEWKMIIKQNDIQLFNLRTDPKESMNVADDNPETAASMQQAIEDFKKNITPGS